MKWWYKLMYNYHKKKKLKLLHPSQNTAYQIHIKREKYYARKLGYKSLYVK